MSILNGSALSGKTSSLDSSSFCYNDHYDGNGGSCGKIGRFYLWSAAIDSASYVKDDIFCGYGDFSSCKLPETVRGVCPEGWHLPSADEKETDELGWPQVYAPLSMRRNEDGFMVMTDMWTGYWTSTDVGAATAKKMNFKSTGVTTIEKNVAFYVRCIQDYETEEAPAEEN